jgi:hypothetical protein
MDTFRKTVTDLIESLPIEGVAMPDGLASIARQIGLLPVAWDMGGCFALAPTGEVVSWAWDEEDRRSLELDALDRHRVLFQGAARYARLRPFLPARAADAQVCPGCKGSGRPVGIPSSIENIVCTCGGAGWLPPLKDGV